MPRLLTAALLTAVLATAAPAADFELAGMRSKTPADWKEEPPSNSMRMAQFKLPKATGDNEDAELAVFVFPGGSGSVDANLKRQLAKFQEDGRKEKVEKTKVGGIDATYQDVSGTFLSKQGGPFDPNAKVTPKAGFRQLYVVFEAKDGKQYYVTLIGPAKTVEKHEKPFKEWMTSFK